MTVLPTARTTACRPPLAATALLLAILAPSAGAQEGSGAALSPPGETAMARLQEGNAAAALEALEPAAKAGRLSPVDRSLLGTIYLELKRPADALATVRQLADAETADPAVLYTAGRSARETGQLDLAAGYLERSMQAVPRSPAARELGLLRAAQGRHVVAYRLLRGWLGIQPADGEARAAAAALALQLERPVEAEELLEGLDPATPKIAILVGQLRMRKGDPRGALEILEPLLSDHPPEMSADLHRILADAYIQTGRAGDAVALLQNGPKGPRLALLLAEAQHRSGDVEAAVATLAPLAEPLLASSRPAEGSFQIALDYGRALVAAGRGAEAVPFLELATELRAGSSLAWKGLADARMAAGKREEAKVALERFRELSEAEAEGRKREEELRRDPVLRAIFEAHEAMAKGEPDRALEVLRREAGLTPDPRLRVVEARYLIGLGRVPEATKVAEEVEARFPGNPDAVYARGMVRLAVDDRAGAETAFREVLAKSPDHVAAMNDLAVLALVAGRKDEARRLLERVLELHPGEPKAKANLDRLAAGG